MPRVSLDQIASNFSLADYGASMDSLAILAANGTLMTLISADRR